MEKSPVDPIVPRWYYEIMKYKLFFIAGIMGIAVISGIIEALSTPRTKTEEGEQRAGEDAMPAPPL
ncbi:MAG: hypothetical protein WA610_13350 [Thermodesulfovibrionales bacterium]